MTKFEISRPFWSMFFDVLLLNHDAMSSNEKNEFDKNHFPEMFPNFFQGHSNPPSAANALCLWRQRTQLPRPHRRSHRSPASLPVRNGTALPLDRLPPLQRLQYSINRAKPNHVQAGGDCWPLPLSLHASWRSGASSKMSYRRYLFNVLHVVEQL